jgi:hypothetical protein
MKETIRIAPPNSIFFIEDIGGGISPEIEDRPVSIWSTASCIIVGCLAFMDGESDFSLSTSSDDAPSRAPAFDGVLETPGRAVEVSTSEREVLIRTETTGLRTRVRIWTNRPKEPTDILAVLG